MSVARGKGKSGQQQRVELIAEARRERIAALYLTGQFSQTELVAELKRMGYANVSQSSVSRDLKALKERWQHNSLEDVRKHVERESAKLDNLEVLLLNSHADLFSSRLSETQLQAQTREIDASSLVLGMIRIMKRRAALLGLDQPKRVAVDANVNNTSNLSDKELEKVILEGEDDDREND